MAEENKANDEQSSQKAGTPSKGEVLQKAKHLKKEKDLTDAYLAAGSFSTTQKSLMQKSLAKDLTDDEFVIFLYKARAMSLDPLQGDLVPVVYSKNDPQKRTVVYITTRDGLLGIAHRSGHFGGIESGSRKKQDPEDQKWYTYGWAKVWNKSMVKPVFMEVKMSEYQPADNPENRKKSPLWFSKPETMIGKVAEVHALRRAFNARGLYIREEMAKEDRDVIDIDGQEVDTDTAMQLAEAIDKRRRDGFTPKALNRTIEVDDGESVQE